MFLKIASSIAIVICCTLLGIHMSYRYKQRIYNIRVLQSILAHLETEIVYYSTFLSQAIRNSIRTLDGDWKIFFIEVADILENRKEYSLAEAWNKSLKKIQKNPCIGKAELDIMYRFGLQLGNSNRQNQQKYFEIAQQQLKIEEENARQLHLRYGKMYRSLGLLLGLGIAIILF